MNKSNDQSGDNEGRKGEAPGDVERYNQGLFSFLERSPTASHAVANMVEVLSREGFQGLREGDAWPLERSAKYYVMRNDASIIAFYTGDLTSWETGVRLCGAHTDSPALKVKPISEIENGGTVRLGVEMYGGALLNSWFDRGLNLAGRVTVLCPEGKDGDASCGDRNDRNEVIKTFLVNFDRAIGIVPSMPIHLDREANSKRNINVQVDMAPLVHLSFEGVVRDMSEASEPGPSNPAPISGLLKKALLKQLRDEHPGVQIKEILAYDLFFSDFQAPGYTGFNKEMIVGPRLDNLLSCHAGLQGMINAQGPAPCLLFCADHEEVGSDTAGGARGSFLPSTLRRLIPDHEKRCRTMAKSFMISWDNAHALHPAHGERYDPAHSVQLNGGPVLKVNAGMRYASDCESSALLKWLCRQAGVPMQTFVMRSDMPCGSTIGPAVSSSTGMKTVDAGAPTWGMHAIREVTGSRDPYMLFEVIRHFFSGEALPLLSLT